MKKILFITMFLALMVMAVSSLVYFAFDVTTCDSADMTYGYITHLLRTWFEIAVILGIFNAMVFLGAYALEGGNGQKNKLG